MSIDQPLKADFSFPEPFIVPTTSKGMPDLPTEPLWLLAELGGDLSTVTNLTDFQLLLMRKLRWLFDYTACFLAIRCQHISNHYYLYNLSSPTMLEPVTEEVLANDWVSRILTTGQPYYLEDLDNLPDSIAPPDYPGTALCANPRSLMLIPLKSGDQVIGTLVFSANQTARYTNLHTQNIATLLAGMLAGQLCSILEHTRVVESLAALQRSQAMTLALAEKRLASDISFALSHRLNNLLAQSISSLEIIQLTIEENGNSVTGQEVLQLNNDLNIALNACNDAGELIKRARQFTGFTRGKVHNWVELTTEAIEIARLLVKKDTRIIPLHEQDVTLLVECDRASAVRTISGLIVNALEASPLKTGLIEVQTGTLITNGNKQLFVEIRDNGQGVNPAIKDRLFEPYIAGQKAASERADYHHLGLSLALAHAFAQSNQGEITYRDLMPHGACFRLILPLAKNR